MKTNGHPRIQVQACGLFVHPMKGWLAASPDAQVNDPDALSPFGIAEIKCPFSKADVTVELACKDALFYCTMDEDKNLETSSESSILPPSATSIVHIGCKLV